jgi:hypothetical protein
MKVQPQEIVGVYILLPSPDAKYEFFEVPEVDAIHIYLEGVTLQFDYFSSEPDNYSDWYIFERGRVLLVPERREIQFHCQVRYSWGYGGGLGYDTTHFYCQTDEEVQTYRLVRYKQQLYFRESRGAKAAIYKRVDRDNEWIYGDRDAVLEKIDEYKIDAVAIWDRMVRDYVLNSLKKGMSVEAIAQNTDFTQEEIKAMQREQ